MNWYKTAQSKWHWGNFVATFGPSVIAGLLALNHFGLLDLQKAFAQNQPKVVQQAQEVQQTQQQFEQQLAQPQQDISEDSLISRLEEGKVDVVPEEEKNTPVPEVVQPSISNNIDLSKIWQIESTSGTDSSMYKPNSSGALGHFQFLEKTWNDMVEKMGKNWDWKTGALDYNKSEAVSDYYLNKNIPYMLNTFNIPDNIKTRIACYSWGIGHLKDAYEEYGENWESVAPQETKDYFVKYGV